MTTQDRRQYWEEHVHAALAAGPPDALDAVLNEIHAADLAEVFPDLEEDEQERILERLSDELAAELLDELDPTDRSHVLDQLPLERASDILEEMPSDEAADLLGELSEHEADTLLQHMEPDVAGEVADLLRYPDDTAGGLMAKEFVRLNPEQSVAEAIALLRRHQDDAEMIYYQYVLDEDDRLLGIVTLRRLIVSDPETDIAAIMQREFVSVPVEMPQDEVADVVRRRDLLAVPVLDGEGRMLGLITVDDIGDVVREEAAEDLMAMSGSEDEPEQPRPWYATLGWRSGLLALAGSLCALALIWLLGREPLPWQRTVILLPMLFVLGLTMGSQAAIAMDRAFDNPVERQQPGRIFRRELTAGAALALIGGLLAGLLVFAIAGQAWRPALALAAPMAMGLWAAAACGALGALVVRRYGGWLGTTTHTVVVILAVLLALTAYLLLSRWTIMLP